LTGEPEIDESMPLEEVAALVCTTLDRHGISVALSGGAVVSIYSDDEYVSHDLDFVPTGLARKVDDAMRSLGFAKEGRRWRHPRSRFWVEFPAGPWPSARSRSASSPSASAPPGCRDCCVRPSA
jgi:hypothetical protein